MIKLFFRKLQISQIKPNILELSEKYESVLHHVMSNSKIAKWVRSRSNLLWEKMNTTEKTIIHCTNEGLNFFYPFKKVSNN